jgi:hypothetical protein
MRPFDWLQTLTGAMALAAMLLLASPGVKAVRAAGDEPASSPAEQCGAASAPSADADLDRFLADLRREQRARDSAGDAEIVMLNGRGYNYGPPPRIDLDLQRARAAETRQR